MAIKSQGQITVIDVTDAYSVMLTSEAYTFVGGTGGVGSGQTCTTEAVAFCGTNQCSSVSVTAGDITCPAGISATVTNSGTSKVKITFTTTATISASDSRIGNDGFTFTLSPEDVDTKVTFLCQLITPDSK